MLRGLLGVGLVLAACTGDVQTYGYVVRDTTGLTEAIVLGPGAPVHVQLRGDPATLVALRALRWEVLAPSADGRSMFIVGTLLDEVHHTPSGPGLAMSEEYREFVLTDWYVKAPFSAVQLAPDWVPGDASEVRERSSLELADFHDFVGKDRFEPAKHVR
jgi:hypothetical protein